VDRPGLVRHGPRRHPARFPTAVMGVSLAAMMLAGTLSCAAHRRSTPGDLLAGSESRSREPVRIVAYTSTDGRSHAFNGYVTVTSDSLIFDRLIMERIATYGSTERVLALSRDQVSSVRAVTGISVGRSIVLGVLLAGFVALSCLIVFFPVYSG